MKPIPLKDNLRILIIRLSAIGDVIHALPSLYALRNAFPGAHIGWVVEDFAAPLIQKISALDRLHCLARGRSKTLRPGDSGKGFRSLLSEVRRERYDVSIDLQGLTKSALWGFLAGCRHRIGYGDQDGREISKWLYNRRVVPPKEMVHVVDRNLSLLTALSISSPTVSFELPVNQEAARWAKDLLDKATIKKFLVVHPGAGWPTKCWPPEFYGELCRRLYGDFGFSVVLSAGPRESELKDRLLGALGETPAIAPSMDQLQLQEMNRLANLFIGPDTGPMHLAVAVETPTVAIFGASDPLRNGPYGSQHLVVAKEIHCRPCWKTSCPQVRCLDDLSVDEVHKEVREFART